MTRSRQVVITGLGAVTPIGSGADGLWEGLRRGEPAGRAITRFDPAALRTKIAAEIDGFEPLEYMDTKKARRLDLFSQLSVAACRQALADAELVSEHSGHSLGSAAVYLGSAPGGGPVSGVEHERYVNKGRRAVCPRPGLSVFGGAGTTNVAMELGIRG